MRAFRDARGIAYSMLSDAKAEIIPAFGLANPQFAKDSPWYGVALPMILVVDPSGTIRRRFSTESHRTPPDIDVILSVLKRDAGG